MTESEFRAGIRARRPKAWAALEQQYGRTLARQASGILPPWQDPENAVGEVWHRALAAAHTYDPSLPPYPWLARICTNTCLNQLRSFSRGLSLFAPRNVAQRPEHDITQAARKALRDALNHLPPRERGVVTLKFLFEVSVADIATLLKLRSNSIHQTLLRGLEHLRTNPTTAPILRHLAGLEEGA